MHRRQSGTLLVLTGVVLLIFATPFSGSSSPAAPHLHSAVAQPCDGPPPKPKPGKKRKALRPPARSNQKAPDCSNSNSNAAEQLAAPENAVGVPECDAYLAKYEACINSKVPESMRATFKSAFDSSRKAWRDAAATPQGKADLATACKAAHDQARTTLRSYGCCW